MRGYLILKHSPKNKASRRARDWVLRRYPPSVRRLNENDRQWFILNKRDSEVVGGEAYYAMHRVTKIKALIAVDDCEKVNETPEKRYYQ